MKTLKNFLSPTKSSFAVFNSALTGFFTICLLYNSFKPYIYPILLIATGLTLLLLIIRILISNYLKRIENDKDTNSREKRYSREKIKDIKDGCKSYFWFMCLITIFSFVGHRLHQNELEEERAIKRTEQAKINEINNNIGKIINLHTDKTEPLPDILYKASAEQDPDCLAALGYLYMTGFNEKAKADYTKAKEYYEKVAGSNRGFVAEYYLGYMHYQGLGINPDRITGLKWVKDSADKGYSQAQALYGSNLYYGRVIKQDLEEAERYLTMASEQDDITAQKMLGVHYLINEKEDDSYYWYGRAANNGDTSAQAIHGGSLFEKKKYDEAIYWLSRAYNADKNDTNSLRYLGLCYRDGKGVEKDLSKAERFFLKTIQLLNTNNGIVKLDLAELYYEIQNYQEALRLAKEAEVLKTDGAEDLVKKLQKKLGKHAEIIS